MPTITVSDAVYKQLESLAVGFDNPNSVILRLIQNELGDAEPLTSKNEYIKNTSTRKSITLDIIMEIYPLAQDVFDNKQDLNGALDYLEPKMDRGSALMYLNTFKAMRLGERYTRTINKTATRYFLEQIFKDYEADGLKKALTALKAHIEYFESFIGGSKMKNTREIHEEFLAKIQ